MPNFWTDIRYALRTLTKNPNFAIIGIVTLALGMAVNTTLFSVINGFLLRPLPVPHPEQITVLSLEQPSLPDIHQFSYQIGRASCRERVWISAVAVSFREQLR